MYDLIVVGCGSGGLATARRASQYNKKVLIIEYQRIGGTCVNVGCVPKKVTYNLCGVFENVKHLSKLYSIQNAISGNDSGCFDKIAVDYKMFKQKRDDYVKRLNKIYDNIISKDANIDYLQGFATVHEDYVVVDNKKYHFKYCLLASGSKSKRINEGLTNTQNGEYSFYRKESRNFDKNLEEGKDFDENSKEVKNSVIKFNEEDHSDKNLEEGKNLDTNLNEDKNLDKNLNEDRNFDENSKEVKYSDIKLNEDKNFDENLEEVKILNIKLQDKNHFDLNSKEVNIKKENISKCKDLQVSRDFVYGEEFLKTSDDFFDLEFIPKKSVIIGSGYIGIEIACILNSLGSEVTLVARSNKLLSHFDSVLGENVAKSMKAHGIEIFYNTKTLRVEKYWQKEKNSKKVTQQDKKEETNNTPEKNSDNFKIYLSQENREFEISDVNFIMSAIGRDCDLSYIKQEIKHKNSYICVDGNFKTNLKNIYAIGDLIGPPYMLTPFAIYCGRLLADHLFYKTEENIVEKFRVNESVASVIFSHPPCASVGMSEEQARESVKNNQINKASKNNENSQEKAQNFTETKFDPEKKDSEEAIKKMEFEFGEELRNKKKHLPKTSCKNDLEEKTKRIKTTSDNHKDEVRIYTSSFSNMLFCFENPEKKQQSIFKIVTINDRVVGLHLFGYGSDEIIQGFAVAIKMGATIQDFKNTVGVHPTAAEEVVTMK